MKRLLTYIMISFIIASSFAQSNYRFVTANLNLRKEPNTTSAIIAIIPKGTEVLIEEDCDCLWIPVVYDGQIGYISTRYLSSNQIKREISTPKQQINYYINSFGNRVQSPTYYDSPPVGATALCRDGTYSFSQNRKGTCSHHGGVAKWLR